MNINNIASKYDGSTTLTELEEMQDRLDNRVEALKDLSKSVQTDNLFELPIRELLALDQEARTRIGHIKILTTKILTINEEIDEIQDKIDILENSTEYTEEEKRPKIEQLKNKIKTYEEIRKGYEKSISELKYELGESNF